METNVFSKKQILGFDVLKIVCMIFISFHHYQYIFPFKMSFCNFYGGFFYFGHFVELFFMISGFLTAYTFKKGHYVKQVVKKILRFFPIATIACIFCMIFQYLLYLVQGNTEQINSLFGIKNLVLNFTLLFEGIKKITMAGINKPTWYLCVLILCLILYYFVRFVTDKIKTEHTILKRSIAFILILIVLYALMKINVFTYRAFRGFESFIIGALIELIVVKKYGILRKNRKIIFLISGILTVASIAVILFYRSQTRNVLLFIFFPILVLLSCLIECGESKLVSFLSKISFEVYIWHYPFLMLLRYLCEKYNLKFTNSFWAMLAFIIITELLSIVIYKWVEKPISSLIHKIIK